MQVSQSPRHGAKPCVSASLRVPSTGFPAPFGRSIRTHYLLAGLYITRWACAAAGAYTPTFAQCLPALLLQFRMLPILGWRCLRLPANLRIPRHHAFPRLLFNPWLQQLYSVYQIRPLGYPRRRRVLTVTTRMIAGCQPCVLKPRLPHATR